MTPILPEVAPAPRPADGRKWVTVRGRVVFPENRTIPSARVVPPGMIKDADFFGFQTYRDVLIDPKTRGLANAVVWLRPDSDEKAAAFPADQVHPGLAAAKPADRSVQACRDGFSPRLTAARAGDRLVFANPTGVVFNVRYQRTTPVDVPIGGEEGAFNVLLPPGKEYTTKLLPALRSVDLYTDSIHPWVRGYVWVFDHPYFAVTDETGDFEIRNAPPGKWRLVVWHEKVGYRHGAKGRTGEPVTLAPGAELKPLALDSDGWDKE